MAGGRGKGRGAADRPGLPRGFGVIWTTVAIDLVGFGLVLPILPQYAERFGVGAALIGVLSASFSLAQMVFAPVWGRLSDRFGRKPILLISLFGTALGSLLTGLAGSIWILFVGRILDGVSGASVSVAQAAVGDVSPPSQRARLMGLLGAAFGVGFVAGPAIGALAALGGPKLPFFIAAAIAAVNGLVAIRRLPETARGVAGHPLADPEVVEARAAEFAAFEAAAGARSEADAAAGPDGAGSVPSEGAVAAALDAERIAAEPALDGPGIVEPAHLTAPSDGGRDVDTRAIVRLIVVAFVAMVAFSGFEATFSLLAQDRFGLELAATSAVFAAIGIVLVAVQAGFVHPVTSRLGEPGTLRFGLVANAVGLGLLAFDLGWGGLVVSLLLLTVGQGLLTPTLSSSVSGRAGRQRGGVARVAAVRRWPRPGDRPDRGRLAVRVHGRRCALRARRRPGPARPGPRPRRVPPRPVRPSRPPRPGGPLSHRAGRVGSRTGRRPLSSLRWPAAPRGRTCSAAASTTGS